VAQIREQLRDLEKNFEDETELSSDKSKEWGGYKTLTIFYIKKANNYHQQPSAYPSY